MCHASDFNAVCCKMTRPVHKWLFIETFKGVILVSEVGWSNPNPTKPKIRHNTKDMALSTNLLYISNRIQQI